MASEFKIGEKCVCIDKNVRYNAIITNIIKKGETQYYQVHYIGFNKRTDIQVKVGEEQGRLEKGTLDNTNKRGTSSGEPVAKLDSKTRKRSAKMLESDKSTVANFETHGGTMNGSNPPIPMVAQNDTWGKSVLSSYEQNYKEMMINANSRESIAKKVDRRDERKKIDENSTYSSVPSDSSSSHMIFLPESLLKMFCDDHTILNKKRGICVQADATIYQIKYELLTSLDLKMNKAVSEAMNQNNESNVKVIKTQFSKLKEFMREIFEYFETIVWQVLLNKEERDFCHQKLMRFCSENRTEKPKSMDAVDYELYTHLGFRVANHFGMIVFVRMLAIFPYLQKDFPFFGRSKKMFKSGMLCLIQYLELGASSLRKCASYAPARTHENPCWIPEKYAELGPELKNMELFEKKRLWKDENGQPMDIQILSVFTTTS